MTLRRLRQKNKRKKRVKERGRKGREHGMKRGGDRCFKEGPGKKRRGNATIVRNYFFSLLCFFLSFCNKH